MHIDKTVSIHPSSIVEDGATIGSYTKVWHWVHISKGASIGSSCILGQNVFIGNNVSIGNNVKVQNNVSIYERVILEDDVFCGPSMVFTNVINPRSAYPKKNQYKTTLVKKGATLGANCTLLCGVTIGVNAFIGAGAVITKDVRDNALYLGNPGKHAGWVSDYGEKIDLPLVGNGSWLCNKTGKFYKLEAGNLISIPKE